MNRSSVFRMVPILLSFIILSLTGFSYQASAVFTPGGDRSRQVTSSPKPSENLSEPSTDPTLTPSPSASMLSDNNEIVNGYQTENNKKTSTGQSLWLIIAGIASIVVISGVAWYLKTKKK